MWMVIISDPSVVTSQDAGGLSGSNRYVLQYTYHNRIMLYYCIRYAFFLFVFPSIYQKALLQAHLVFLLSRFVFIIRC